MIAPLGPATAAGTRAFAERHGAAFAPDFYSAAHGLSVSSLGLGTYRGREDAATDQGYEDAVVAALEGGINNLDTAVSYRAMASERAVGRALARAARQGIAREGVVVATKGGYVPRDVHLLAGEEVTPSRHCLSPGFLQRMLETSLANLGLACVDVYYLHNPEAQLQAGVPRDVFLARCRAAFEVLEEARRRGLIGAYGTATWSGYRLPAGAPEGLVLEEMVALAREAAGSDDHGLRWVQLPVNLGMPEALAHATQRVGGETVTLVEAARRLGVAVVASGSLANARLAEALPAAVARARWPAELATNAQRALQFARSAPGVTSALVGMSRVAHVRENLAVARTPRLGPASYRPARGGG